MLKSIFIQIALNVSCTLIYRSCAEVNAPVKVLLKDYIYIYIPLYEILHFRENYYNSLFIIRRKLNAYTHHLKNTTRNNY